MEVISPALFVCQILERLTNLFIDSCCKRCVDDMERYSDSCTVQKFVYNILYLGALSKNI